MNQAEQVCLCGMFQARHLGRISWKQPMTTWIGIFHTSEQFVQWDYLHSKQVPQTSWPSKGYMKWWSKICTTSNKWLANSEEWANIKSSFEIEYLSHLYRSKLGTPGSWPATGGLIRTSILWETVLYQVTHPASHTIPMHAMAFDLQTVDLPSDCACYQSQHQVAGFPGDFPLGRLGM